MADLLILNGTVVTMDPDRKILKNGAVAVQGNRIAAVGSSEDLKRNYSTENRIDAQHKLVLPGLVNLHTHIDLTLCRGTCEDRAEASLFEIMMPIMEIASREDLYWLAKLGCLELLRFRPVCQDWRVLSGLYRPCSWGHSTSRMIYNFYRDLRLILLLGEGSSMHCGA